MKRMLMIVCGIMGGVSVYATPQPKADVHFRVTDDLPKLAWPPPRGYSDQGLSRRNRESQSHEESRSTAKVE